MCMGRGGGWTGWTVVCVHPLDQGGVTSIDSALPPMTEVSQRSTVKPCMPHQGMQKRSCAVMWSITRGKSLGDFSRKSWVKMKNGNGDPSQGGESR